MSDRRRTKEELLEEYSDSEWIRSFVRLNDIVAILENCILSKDYKLPDELASSLSFTPDGTRMRDFLIRKHSVNPKVAKIIVLLELYHNELFIDPMMTDIAALESTIDKQVSNGSLIYPFSYGREMYDRASDLFETERKSLTYPETLRLLEEIPQGIAQYGEYVVGPFGLLKTQHSRYIPSETRVPLYHCADIACGAIHTTQLASDPNFSVNESRTKLAQHLRESGEPSDFGGYFVEVAGLSAIRLDQTSLMATVYALGDCLSDDELRTYFACLLDSTEGRLRGQLARLGRTVGASNATADTLNRPQILQLCLLESDSRLCEMMDELVQNGKISVPRHEVRSPRVNSRVGLGTFDLSPQINEHGIRFASRSDRIEMLRLQELVASLFKWDDAIDRAELDWLLRGVDGTTLEARLSAFVRSQLPSRVLERLALGRAQSVELVCGRLGIDLEKVADDDSRLQNAILWKLGFDAPDNEGIADRFWLLHETMKNVLSAAQVSAVVDQERVRQSSVSYFVALEELLIDTLGFTTWCLTTDHPNSHEPFSFRPDSDPTEAWVLLNEQAKQSCPTDPPSYGGDMTFHPLCRGFGVLADHLERLEREEIVYRRSDIEMPEYDGKTTLREFPFRHVSLFLDLTTESRKTIVQELREVGRTLERAKLSMTRNDQLHFRVAEADFDSIASCLNGVEKAIRTLENLGFARTLYSRTDVVLDEWGRELHTLRNLHGREIVFVRPSRYSWSRMPPISSPQYLVPATTFAEPNEMLRFHLRVASQFTDYWHDYPRRRRPSGNSTSSEERVVPAGGKR